MREAGGSKKTETPATEKPSAIENGEKKKKGFLNRIFGGKKKDEKETEH